ncbi:MAG: hypothetical protein ACRC62_31645, partial [Microcoleus sp.]
MSYSQRPPRHKYASHAQPEGSPRSRQRPISSIGAPKVNGHQVAAWGRVSFVTVFFFGLSAILFALLVFLSVVWLMPPWFGFFGDIQNGIADNIGIFPRAVYGVLSLSSTIAIAAYVLTQGYQSAESLEMFGVKLPKAESQELRNYFYAGETIIVSQQAFKNAVGGFTGNLGNHIIQIFGFIGANPVSFVGVLLMIATQVMVSERLIYLSAKAFKHAQKTMMLNAGVAAKQNNVTTARPEQWAGDRTSQRPAQTVDVPATPAEGKPEPKRQTDRESKANYAHGEFFQDQNSEWKYWEVKDGTGRARIAKVGATIEYSDLNGTQKFE